jgi:outer membrane protein assembly factor BamC
MNKIIILLLIMTLTACYEPPKQNNELGKRNIDYYADKSVATLEVPPDLTKPNEKFNLDLKKVTKDVDVQYADFSKQVVNNKKNILGIVVKKKRDKKWLLVSHPFEKLWLKTARFLKNNNFIIKKSNKNIGLMETNFLENKPDIPKQSLGFIQSLLKDTFKKNYSTGIIDKYKVRLEPTEDGKQTEIFLTLVSMEEIVTKKGTDEEKIIWQPREKDIGLETEMLYKLMVFLGNDRNSAKEKILNAKEIKGLNVELKQRLGGNVTLVFPLGFKETWYQLAWALDELDIKIDDKDSSAGAIYIDMSNDKNAHLEKMFNKKIMENSYQLLLKANANQTVVLLNLIGDGDIKQDLNNSKLFLGRIAKTFQ